MRVVSAFRKQNTGKQSELRNHGRNPADGANQKPISARYGNREGQGKQKL
jgi:hypothetical protein